MKISEYSIEIIGELASFKEFWNKVIDFPEGTVFPNAFFFFFFENFHSRIKVWLLVIQFDLFCPND